MRGVQVAIVAGLIVVPSGLAYVSAQRPSTASRVTLYEGARLIVGDGNAPIENSAFLVERQPVHAGRTKRRDSGAGRSRPRRSDRQDGHSRPWSMRTRTSAT